jgi:hypothetical protein
MAFRAVLFSSTLVWGVGALALDAADGLVQR